MVYMFHQNSFQKIKYLRKTAATLFQPIYKQVSDWTGATYTDRKYVNKYTSQFVGNNQYTYFHEEDESSFKLVDNTQTKPRTGFFRRGPFAKRQFGKIIINFFFLVIYVPDELVETPGILQLRKGEIKGQLICNHFFRTRYIDNQQFCVFTYITPTLRGEKLASLILLIKLGKAHLNLTGRTSVLE